jgi:uncharacterized protein YjcR
MVDTRERILQLLRDGRSQAEIARELAISKPAVSKHVAHLVKDGRWKKQEGARPRASPDTPPKSKSNRRPPPPGPHSTGFKEGNPGGPGAPPGNKNAVTHGLYESLAPFLTEEERALYFGGSTDTLAHIQHELLLISVRERRMIERIDRLKQAADDLAMTTVEITEEAGANEKGPFAKKSIKRMGILGQIQGIEEALTKVQNTKAKLIELKAKLEAKGTPDEDNGVAEFLEALNAKASAVWADYSETEEDDESDGGDAE